MVVKQAQEPKRQTETRENTVKPGRRARRSVQDNAEVKFWETPLTNLGTHTVATYDVDKISPM